MREIIMKQSRDIEALRHELKSRWKHVPALPSVRFNSRVEVNQIPAHGEQFKIADKPRVYSKVYPIDHPFFHDQINIDDARLEAIMLAFIVRREVEGQPAKCVTARSDATTASQETWAQSPRLRARGSLQFMDYRYWERNRPFYPCELPRKCNV